MGKVIFKPLSREDTKYLLDLAKSMFLNGQCYDFALALHEGLGWPLIGLAHEDTIWHAALLTPEDKYFDIRGEHTTVEELARDISGLPSAYAIVSLESEQLRTHEKVSGFGIERALWMAQAIWPDLKWKKGPHPRYRAFLEELFALSEKHRIFIFAPYPTAWPILTEAHGDEHYVFTPSMTGQNYSFDRVLEHDLDRV